MPFNRFLIEQLAGDLMKDANNAITTATCFPQLGAKVLAEPDRDKLEMDTIDEQRDTMGKVFLGKTFGCVRCHDHKFDPIKQSDYYSLAAIFKSTKTTDNLIAAAKFDLEAPFTHIEVIAETQRLSPHILHHCRGRGTKRTLGVPFDRNQLCFPATMAHDPNHRAPIQERVKNRDQSRRDYQDSKPPRKGIYPDSK